LATLSRHAVTAASQTAELLGGLHVDTGRMAAVVERGSSALLAEQRSIRGLFETSVANQPPLGPGHYLGAAGAVIDAILIRARDDQEST
jgi:3-carboxy-cis,cis-muconate cycloisomerase